MPKAAAEKEGPKRPTTAFFFFSNDKREKVKAELGAGAKAPDVSKRLGELWKEMTAEQKKPYDLQAEKDKKRYHDEGGGAAAGGAGKKAAGKKAKKDEGEGPKIKRASSAWMHFCNDRRPAVREENPSAGMTDLVKIMSEEWKGMGDAQKKPYEEMAKRDKEREQREKAAAGK